MANTINWGRVYCFTEFGDEDLTIAEAIPAASAPACFVGSKGVGQIETLAITSDDIRYKADSALINADQETVEL